MASGENLFRTRSDQGRFQLRCPSFKIINMRLLLLTSSLCSACVSDLYDKKLKINVIFEVTIMNVYLRKNNQLVCQPSHQLLYSQIYWLIIIIIPNQHGKDWERLMNTIQVFFFKKNIKLPF